MVFPECDAARPADVDRTFYLQWNVGPSQLTSQGWSRPCADTTAPGFRGCAYANLAAEFCDEDHPARGIAGEHRTWLLAEVHALLDQLGVEHPDLVAEQLVMLRAGAMAVASVGRTDQMGAAFRDAWTALVDRTA